MNHLLKSGFLLMLALLLGPQFSLAQESGTPPGTPEASEKTLEQRKADQKAHMQDLLRKIEEVKHERMKTALALDDETAAKFFEIYKPAEKEIQAIVKERNDELKKLTLLMNGAKTDADVDPEMQRIRDLNQKIEARTQKLDSDLKPVLSPRQRARLLVFEHEFNKRIREQIARRQMGRNMPPKMRELRRQLRQERMKRMLERRENGAKPQSEKR